MQKFTQLVKTESSLIGLCDDGSTWYLENNAWLAIPLLPQFEESVKDEPVKEVKKRVKKLYWYHAESDSCGIAKDEDDLLSICNADGLSEPCTKATYDKCVKANAEKVDEPVEEIIEQKEVPVLNYVDLKSACLKSARADSANRDKLKALLKTYGAVKAVDVPTDKLAEVIGKIEKGEF